MKWIALLIFVGIVPVLSIWLRQNPKLAPRVWAAMGLLPFVMDPWHLIIAPISWAMWPGYVKGLELSLLDFVALAVLISRPRRIVGKPIKIAFAVYIACILFSMFFSGVPMAAFFSAWQLSRALLIFAAVANICTDERGPAALILGMAIGLTVQAGYSIEARLSGVTQASGTFGHQNLLGMITHFVVFPALALLLVDGRRRAPWFAVGAGMICAILGASRATIGFAGAGYVGLLVLSMARRPTSRKGAMMGIVFLVLAVAAPFAMSSLQERFNAAPISGDYDERAAFERAAHMIIDDHPMGIGANQYVVMVNTGGYSDRAGVVPTSGSRSANVHNTYLLVRAETGLIGLAGFLGLLLTPLFLAFRASWRHRKDPRGDLLLGLGVTLAVVAVHCFYEWIFVVYPVQALFAMDLGIIAGLVRQMETRKVKRARLEPPPAAAAAGAP